MNIVSILLALVLLFNFNIVGNATNEVEFSPDSFVEEDKFYLEQMAVKNKIDEQSLKKEVDELNKRIDELYNSYHLTKNGAKVYTAEQIEEIDTLKRAIVMRLELMILEDLDEFNYVEFPMVSEIEQYGIISNYPSVEGIRFFEEQNAIDAGEESYWGNVDVKYFENQSFQDFVAGIEALEGLLNVEGVNIVFSPYKTLGSYAYYENYIPEELFSQNMRRSRVYFLPRTNVDYVSTLYHELGHLVYHEYVLHDKELLDEYYSFYEEQFNANDAIHTYEWDKKLTECFAEDYKIYSSNKIYNRNETVRNLIDKNKNDYLKNDTIYKTKKDLNSYFDKFENYTPIIKPLRPDIRLKVDDYKEEFKYFDFNYLDEYVNKIPTCSKQVVINIDNIEESILKPTTIEVVSYDEEYDIIHEKTYKVKEENKIRLLRDYYETEIIIHFENGEDIVYYVYQL